MAEYIDREKIHFHAFYDAGDYSQAMRCINNMTPADVIERSKIDKAIDEIITLRKQYHNDDYYDCKHEVLEILRRI